MSRVIVNDPVYEVMDFGPDNTLKNVLKDIVDTNEFQRLRRISQLGFTSYVYPGAVHTRFSHCLGAAYLSHLVLNKLSETEDCTELQNQDNKSVVLSSSLLHDIGHGPFSHLFEHAFSRNKNIKSKVKNDKECFDHDFPGHENWTVEIIKNNNTGINKALLKNRINIEMMISAIDKKTESKLPTYLKQIISSQIDVDRMDYLLRDSHFTGVTIGKFDLIYLINCLQIINHSDKEKPKTLGLCYKGVRPYEGYLMARHMMNKAVYYHRKVKVAEFMAETILSFVDESRQKGCYVPKYLIDVKNAQQKKDFGKDNFLNESLRSYLDFTEDDFWVCVKHLATSSNNEIENRFARKLLSRNILPNYIISRGKEDVLFEALVDEGFELGTDFVLLNTNSVIYKQNFDSEVVFVKDANGQIKDISQYSMIINALGDKPESENILVLLKDEKSFVSSIERILKISQLSMSLKG